MMRVAVLDEAALAEIAALCLHADTHRLPLEEQTRVSRGARPPVGDDPDFSLTISGIYRCVFSIEEHPGGWMRHLSISIIDPNRERPMPSPEAVQAIAQEFGFRARFSSIARGDLVAGTVNGAVWIEGNRAINMVERLETATRGKSG